MSETLAHSSATKPEKEYPTILKSFISAINDFKVQERTRQEYNLNIQQDPYYYAKDPSGFMAYGKYLNSTLVEDRISLNLSRLLSNISDENVSKIINYILNQPNLEIDPITLVNIAARPIKNDDFFFSEVSKYGLDESEMKHKSEIFIQRCLEELFKKEDYKNLQELMLRNYSNESIRKAALNLVLLEDISDKQRLELAKVFINSFGFITLIDSISEYGRNEAGRPDIKKLYATLNGEEVEKLIQVFRKPDEIYKIAGAFKKEHYPQQVTEFQLNQILEILDSLGIDAKEASVLDLGAGLGRISFGLIEEGVGKVYSVDIDPTLQESLRLEFEKRQQEDPTYSELLLGSNFEIVRGDWYTLSENPAFSHVDLGVCVGRSLPHANNMSLLVQALSQMIKVSDNWLIDYPDSDASEYQKSIAKLQENFENLGINSKNALMVFDGPNSKYLINRMVASPEQLQKIGKLLGFKVEKIAEESINFYFKLTKEENWDYLDLSFEEVLEICEDLGLIFPEAIDIVLPGWDMTLAQVLAFYFTTKRIKDLENLSEDELRNKIQFILLEIKQNNYLYQKQHPGEFPKSHFETIDSGRRILIPNLDESRYFYNYPCVIDFSDN